MDMFIADTLERNGDWPDACHDKYDRIEVLGKGSFGQVWMARRIVKPKDEFDDEFVAIKSIHIKDEKGKVYAEREIRILQEIRHPNVIRLVQAYPVHANKSRVVVMQLARGPNLHQLVVKGGALGLPLARLVSRQLIAAVSYLHGRAVIHRDIKPSNCILALADEKSIMADYDWLDDRAIWSNKEDCKQAVRNSRWKLMLVDFGFARALEHEEIVSQAKKMRNSIVFESTAAPKQEEVTSTAPAKTYTPRHINEQQTIPEENDNEENSIAADIEQLESMVIKAVDNMRDSYVATNDTERAIFAEQDERTRHSGVSMQIPTKDLEEPVSPKTKKKANDRRVSTARNKVRSMSALGTKAYAAPEIRKQLRQKTDADFEKANAAMTECVADYGMIVDAYSVGWTLRVAMTGVPPHFTISEYMKERDNVMLEEDEDHNEEDDSPESAGFCCCYPPVEISVLRVRDPLMLPTAALMLINRLTEKNPENRMTVRESQLDHWIAGNADESDPTYVLPEGDVPSKHGDPVVPLSCAEELSKLTVEYHMS